jgi:hypothetical protein
MRTATCWLCSPATTAACWSLSGFCGKDRAEQNQRFCTSSGTPRGMIRSPRSSKAPLRKGDLPYQTAISFQRLSRRLSAVIDMAATFG